MTKYNVILSYNEPKNALIQIPGSKSYTNRAILIAAISNGVSVIKNFLHSDDTRYMIYCLKNLGVKITENDNALTIEGNNGNFTNIANPKLFCGIAGTTSRFTTGLSILINQDLEINGEKKLLERPIEDLVHAMTELGVKTDYLGKPGSLPLKIYGDKQLQNNITINGNVSSQFISALLMVAPRISNGLEIQVIGEQVSKSYIDMTISIMQQFGVKVINDNYKKYIIKEQEYQPQNYIVEGDWSGASYFLAIAGLLNNQSKITNIDPNSVQGDAKLVKILELFGIECIFDNKSAIVIKKDINQDTNFIINMSQMPDTAMTIMVLAGILNQKITITGLSTLKDKECDRIEMPKQELAKFGIKCETTKDSITVYGNTFNETKIITVDTFDDHRMAMSFAIFGLKHKVLIKDAGVVDKSFSSFWQELVKFGFKIEYC